MSDIDDIKKILEKHEKRLSKLEKLVNLKPLNISIDAERVITDLISSGFFDTKKRLSEITKKLKIQAKFDKSHKYSEILEKFTRYDKLTRKMSGHQWWYSKK